MFGRFRNSSYICFVGLRERVVLTPPTINQSISGMGKNPNTIIMVTLTNNNNFNVTYKGVTYKVSLNTTKSELYVDGSYLCPFEYNGIDWKNEQHLTDEIYDCVGGWVEGYEIYSLRANTMNDVDFKQLLTNEFLIYKQRAVEYLTEEEFSNYTEPTEGDLECIIESLIEENVLPDTFFTLRKRAMIIFGIKEYSKW
jgi:hypothetical protein